ncbi:MAG: type II toxin-antitoxin system RelE family toxin [Dehalococcoidia bacterium]
MRRALEQLLVDFGSGDAKKLAGRPNEWRLRVGRWRVILELDNQAGLINATRVLPRDRAYRD